MKPQIFIITFLFISSISYSQDWKKIKEQKIEVKRIGKDSTFFVDIYEQKPVDKIFDRDEFSRLVQSEELVIFNSSFSDEKGIWTMGTWNKSKQVYERHRLDLEGVKVYKEKYKNRFFPPTITFFTIPVKVRPSVDYIPFENAKPGGNNESAKFDSEAKLGLSNLYIGINPVNRTKIKYFSSGKEVRHKFLGGVFLGFASEELNKQNLNLDPNSTFEKQTQAFFSYGIHLTYAYNDVSFSFIPAGFDTSLNSLSESYVFNNKLWWGFGIGITFKQMGEAFGFN